MTVELSEEHRAVLDFERDHQWWKFAAAKETAIRETFGWTAVRYFQVLDHVLDLSAAAAYDAQTVNRLRRLRDGRGAARSSRRLVTRCSGRMGIFKPDPILERQKTAGEEDQSVAGWDSFP